jgi:hypothetical protein
VVRAPVDLRPRVVPRLEDGAHGAQELGARVLGEALPGLLAVDLLEGIDDLRPVVLVVLRQRVLEALPVDSVDDLSEHLDQAPVRIVREARVARALGETPDCVVVQTEVEDRVHHPRHRDGGAGAHRDEERVVRIAEALPGLLLERGQVLVDLALEPVWKRASGRHVGAAGVGRDREPGRHGHAELRHLGEADALAAEQLAPATGVFVEVVDVSVRSHVLKSSHRLQGFRLLAPREKPSHERCRASPSGRFNS